MSRIPVQNEDGSWRIRMDYELNELIGNADIVRFIKSRRIAWCRWMIREHQKEYCSGNLLVRELEGDYGRDGLQALKKICK
jgi:hypothetical protein